MSAHGQRIGSATHVSCAAACPPPIAYITIWGNWSLGKVRDIYWQFAEECDAYLGRCLLCGLDPNHTTFSVPPPSLDGRQSSWQCWRTWWLTAHVVRCHNDYMAPILYGRTGSSIGVCCSCVWLLAYNVWETCRTSFLGSASASKSRASTTFEGKRYYWA